MSLDRLLRDGPPSGDIVGSLESVRLKILDQGIKADSDGMVSVSLRLTGCGRILIPKYSHP
jgi:cell cycle arrest protein BUB2